MTELNSLEHLGVLASMLGYRYDAVYWSPAGFTVVLEDTAGEELRFTAGSTDKAVEAACDRLALLLGQVRP